MMILQFIVSAQAGLGVHLCQPFQRRSQPQSAVCCLVDMVDCGRHRIGVFFVLKVQGRFILSFYTIYTVICSSEP